MLTTHNLRPYQVAAVNQIFSHWREGRKKVLLHLDTGAGKTEIFSHVARAAAAKYQVLIVVHGRQLVDQAARRVGAGTIMAGRRPEEHPIQVASIDTLIRRELLPEAKVVIIDEAHMCGSEKWQEFASYYQDKYMLSVTATPYQDASIAHIASEVIRPVTMIELIEQGYLLPCRYFAPSTVQLQHIKKLGGDYNNLDLSEVMSAPKIVGDIIASWRARSEGRSTLLFACNVEHSKTLAKDFVAAGIPAEHADADTPDQDRAAIISRSKSGETKIITNCNIFSTGIDLPWVSCIVMARPTLSVVLYLQQLGRGTRPYPNKQDFLLLDHAGNCQAHGFAHDEREALLEGRPKSKTKGSAPVKTCPECFAVVPAGLGRCLHCSHMFESASQDGEIREAVDSLSEFTGHQRAHQVESYLARKRGEQEAKGYKEGWLWHQLAWRFGRAIASREIPTYVPKDRP